MTLDLMQSEMQLASIPPVFGLRCMARTPWGEFLTVGSPYPGEDLQVSARRSFARRHILDDPQAGAHAQLMEALSHLELALGHLDEADAPADIGAHVDLAISRLRGKLYKGTDVSSDLKRRSATN